MTKDSETVGESSRKRNGNSNSNGNNGSRNRNGNNGNRDDDDENLRGGCCINVTGGGGALVIPLSNKQIDDGGFIGDITGGAGKKKTKKRGSDSDSKSIRSNGAA